MTIKIILILFFVINILLCYTIFTGHYDKYDKRLKHPLWLILIFSLISFISIFGTVILGAYIGCCADNKEYFKSFLTKNY